MSAFHRKLQYIGKHGRGKPGRVGIDEKETGVIGKKLGAQLDERVKIVLDLPHLAGRTSAVARRVHQDAVVPVAAPEFALHELHAVVDDVADRRIE